MKLDIFLNDIAKVKEFVTMAQSVKQDTILHSGKYAVDAKSIMGVFSLDLSKPLVLEIEFDDETTVSEAREAMSRFLTFEV